MREPKVEEFAKALPVDSPVVQDLRGRDAMAYLVDVIESERWGFNMNDGRAPTCGTPGCIMGHAAAIWPDCAVELGSIQWYISSGCMARLELTFEQFNYICYPSLHGFFHMSRRHAVALLRKYTETGELSWE